MRKLDTTSLGGIIAIAVVMVVMVMGIIVGITRHRVVPIAIEPALVSMVGPQSSVEFSVDAPNNTQGTMLVILAINEHFSLEYQGDKWVYTITAVDCNERWVRWKITTPEGNAGEATMALRDGSKYTLKSRHGDFVMTITRITNCG